jgi:hypothetical protein
MHSRRSTIACRPRQEASASTAPPPSATTPERPPQAAPRRPRPTPSDPTLPAESVRVTDVPARGRARAYLVERELEQDGYEALKALVADYLDQAALLEDVPMAVSPLTGTRSENLEGAEQ